MTALIDETGHIDLDQVYVREAEAKVVDVDDDGIVEVKIVPYEVETKSEIDHGVWEIFTRGAFASAVGNPSRVKVTDQGHQRQVVVGHAVELREEPSGHYGKLKIADTSNGRDMLTLFRAGSLTELSVEFRMQKRGYTVTDRPGGGKLLRQNKAILVGVSPVGAGAYGEEARVLAVREAARASVRERVLAELSGLTSGPRRG